MTLFVHPAFSTSVLLFILQRLDKLEKKYLKVDELNTFFFSYQIILKECFCLEIIVELLLLK